MKDYYARLKEAVRSIGRNPGDCNVTFAFQPIVGETTAIAQENARLHNDLINADAGLVLLSGHLGHDLSKHDLDAGIDTIEVEGARTFAQALTSDGARVRTLREIAFANARGVNTPQIDGSPGEIADWMEETMEAVGGDGFMVSPVSVPTAMEEFVDLVVPELQRRRIMRDGYESDKTFREQLLAF